MLLTGVLGRITIKNIAPLKFDPTFDEADGQRISLGIVIGMSLVSIVQFLVLQVQVIESSFDTQYQAALTIAFFITVFFSFNSPSK